MLSARQRSYPLAAHWRDHAGSYAFDLHSGGLRESQNVFMGGNHGRNQVASAQLISRELGRKRKSVAEGILRPRLAVFRRPRCEAGLHPRPSRSGWFGLQTRGLRVDMEASAASIFVAEPPRCARRDSRGGCLYVVRLRGLLLWDCCDCAFGPYYQGSAFGVRAYGVEFGVGPFPLFRA